MIHESDNPEYVEGLYMGWMSTSHAHFSRCVAVHNAKKTDDPERAIRESVASEFGSASSSIDPIAMSEEARREYKRRMAMLSPAK